ncbi:MAG: mononuclear molybdenum enzyme YedY [Acidobacteria bacterium RIFCSPLOWO2_12_FULL_60_22]|nr:MAG: mononuclear molybdenum enzyme YedY [Acidobacteria bacterium RIFCSPLOWO2_12_FULL_60_22]
MQRGASFRSSEITPKSVYLSRRKFLAGTTVAGAMLLAGRPSWETALASPQAGHGRKLSGLVKSPFSTDEKINSFNDVTHYNNFYEFGTDKEQPATLAKNFKTYPWTVAVEGDVGKPGVYDIDKILKLAPLEERIYRHRCVEAWSIVVPWIGFPLNVLIHLVEPASKAKFVAFQTLYDPKQMPHGRYAGIPFPYVEGLRMDEAMHPLALLCVGMYGEVLPNQNGAPLRLVVPWKYGFKSIKSIVKIRFQEKQPPTTWNLSAPNEYGFYSNVNPKVDHPRWTQASERRLGEIFKRKTLPFNGYADQVAQLYTGMDLKKNY